MNYAHICIPKNVTNNLTKIWDIDMAAGWREGQREQGGSISAKSSPFVVGGQR